MINRWSVALIVILLMGCVREVKPPAVVEVKIPVPVKCEIHQPAVPAFAVSVLPLGSPIDAQMRALRAERHQRIGYELLLRAEIDKCKK